LPTLPPKEESVRTPSPVKSDDASATSSGEELTPRRAALFKQRDVQALQWSPNQNLQKGRGKGRTTSDGRQKFNYVDHSQKGFTLIKTCEVALLPEFFDSQVRLGLFRSYIDSNIIAI
jgi:hypothetical protein